MIERIFAVVDAGDDHGGSLYRAGLLFPHAPEPWIDLSTGINPHSYPHRSISSSALSRLPDASDEARLRVAAATAYGVASPANVFSAPGTQILLPLAMSLKAPGCAVVLSPTYSEHARAARMVGHTVVETVEPQKLASADVAVVVNPNNPDGRVLSLAVLRQLAKRLAAHGGLLVVDEAFMDVGPREESAVSLVEELPVVVLRSFGKFFGLAGVRLGFAIASQAIALRLAAQVGPWAVSGPALEIGARALADLDWQALMRARLSEEAARLDRLLPRDGTAVSSGTNLYRFMVHSQAPSLFRILGEAGIIVRAFKWRTDALRFGLPGSEDDWVRLEVALTQWSVEREKI
ncbi:threonine-phosphate decarboxylase CobD [Mesorhizobium sp. 2RAF21]|uniref:threonine-phosphate decarboxylase CobD n=1 Tax=Mesorhizobium sp. 2RAF21 TaxID=3232995 RepID=UPI003F99E23F